MKGERINEDEINNHGLPPVRIPAAPSGYFEEFPDRILNRWGKEASQQKKARIHWVVWVKVAAAVLVVVLLWNVLVPKDKDEMQPISSLEAYQYIEEHIDQFEGLIETSEINFIETAPEINPAAVEEYLLENTEEIDPEDIF